MEHLTCFTVYLENTTIFPLRKPDLRYITWGLIWDPFYKELKGRIDFSDMFAAWNVLRTCYNWTIE